MNVDAVVVARGVPGAPDPLTPVGGVPMIARSVRAVLAGLSTTERSDRVIVVAPPERRAAVERACAGLPVDVYDAVPAAAGRARSGEAHVTQRANPAPGDGRRLGSGGSALTLLHDAARPLAPPSLVAAVLAEAATTGCVAAVPVLPLTDTVKLVDGADLVTATPDRAHLRVLQTPQAIRTDLLVPGEDPFAAVLRLAADGAVHHVPGDPAAFPVLTAWDLQLAELLVD
jgi:2-C-methyl-D-erythritol 4-phosphate cytidylyltransferase